MPPAATIFRLFLIAVPFLSFIVYLDIDFSSWPHELFKASLIAIIATLVAKHGGGFIFEEIGEVRSDKTYGLEHGRLNLELPMRSMWMNMGFWKDTKEFPIACSNLLHEVLETAKIPPQSRIRLLDLGFGCGDQTLELMSLGAKWGCESRHPFLNESTEERQPLIVSYTGITLNKAQYGHAIIRLANSEVACSPAQLFQHDAADPGSWDHPDLLAQIAAMKTLDVAEEDKGAAPKNWILALDSFYHFSPSRIPILKYAHRDLNASVMAFDLLLSDKATLSQRILLSCLAKLMGCPKNAFMREREYRRMLREAGYMLGNVEMRDVSEHCFSPLAEYLERREDDLRGIGWTLGKFRAAKWMFGWWARTGIVRGIIIVART
ncbi:hypothetical protein E2P81_ATG12064 [Venturia nashicola]|nr:hypothetical protein E2P81_ATG12064 [Venturia nashicola]